MKFNIDDIIDDVKLVFKLLYDEDDYTKLLADKMGIVKDMVISRLDKDKFKLNEPVIIALTNVTPKVDIVVVKVSIGDNIVLIGTERIYL